MLAGEDYQEINAKYRLNVSDLFMSGLSTSSADQVAGVEGHDVTVYDRGRIG